MLQFPYAVYPDGQALDGEVDNIFSCMISGTICTAYQITIYNRDNNSIVYQGKVNNVNKYNQEELEMDIPANSFTNGKDLIWGARLWTDVADMKIASNKIISVEDDITIKIEPYSGSRIKGGQKIYINNKYYTVSGYDLSPDGTFGYLFTLETLSNVNAGDLFTIYSDFIDTPKYFFKARNSPQISITDMPSNISSRRYNFIGNYSQIQNVPIQYYIFNLYDSLYNLIDTTGKIYSSNIKYTFDGFTNGETYYLELICNNQDNVEIITDKHKFSVSYVQPNMDLSIGSIVLEDKDAVRLILEPDKTSVPKFNGQYSIIENFPFVGTNSASISKDNLIYDNISEVPLNINDESYTLFMSTRLNNGFQGKIIELSGDNNSRYIELKNYTFYDNNNGIETKINSLFDSDKFVLQDNVEDNVGYIWDDSATWNNSKYWWFPTRNLENKQLKITILPNSSNIIKGA